MFHSWEHLGQTKVEPPGRVARVWPKLMGRASPKSKEILLSLPRTEGKTTQEIRGVKEGKSEWYKGMGRKFWFCCPRGRQEGVFKEAAKRSLHCPFICTGGCVSESRGSFGKLQIPRLCPLPPRIWHWHTAPSPQAILT